MEARDYPRPGTNAPTDLIGGLVRPGLPDLPELGVPRLSGAAGAASSQVVKGCGSFVGGEGKTDAE